MIFFLTGAGVLRLGRAYSYAAAAVAMLVAITACILLFAEDRRRGFAWTRRIGGTATPEALAAIRIVVLTILFAVVLWEDAPSSALIPRTVAELRGKGVMSLLALVPGYEAFLTSYAALSAFRVLLLSLLALGIVGLHTRVVLPLAAVGYLIHGGVLRHYAHFFHQGLLPLYAIALLAFTPCADAWSLDRRRRQKLGLPVPPAGVADAVYGVSRFAVFAMIGLCYFSAGWSKIRDGGLGWWDATNMRSKILMSALEPKLSMPTGMWMALQPAWVLAALGIFTLVVECAMLFVLVSRRSRFVLAPAISLLHVGIVFSQDILFLDLIALPLVFLQPHHLARAAAALPRGWSAARPHLRAALEESGFKRGAPAQLPSADQPAAAKEREARPPGRLPLFVASALAVYSVCIVFAIEWYPLTAWQMFSKRLYTGEIEYLRAREQRASGAVVKMQIHEDLGALHDTRYDNAIWPHFHKGDAASRQRLDELLAAAMKLRNARVPPDERIVRFVIEHRRWDWERSPHDPDRGETVNVYTFPPEPR